MQDSRRDGAPEGVSGFDCLSSMFIMVVIHAVMIYIIIWKTGRVAGG
jgi:hypothetical protein